MNVFRIRYLFQESFIRKIKIFCKREEIDALVNPSLVNSCAIFNLAKLPKELLLHFGGISFRSTSIHSNKCRVLHNCNTQLCLFKFKITLEGEKFVRRHVSHMVLFGKYMILLLFPHYFATLDQRLVTAKIDRE